VYSVFVGTSNCKHFGGIAIRSGELKVYIYIVAIVNVVLSKLLYCWKCSFLIGNSSKLLWFESWEVFVNIIPEWHLSVNYFNLCQQCNKLYAKATIPVYDLCSEYKTMEKNYSIGEFQSIVLGWVLFYKRWSEIANSIS